MKIIQMNRVAEEGGRGRGGGAGRQKRRRDKILKKKDRSMELNSNCFTLPQRVNG